MAKKSGLVVKFDIRDAVDSGNMYDDGEDAEAPEGGEDEEQEDGVAVPFVAEIKLENSTLTFRCTATEVVEIDGVELLADGADVDNLYGGPQFDELDPELQDAFHDYLAAAGVDDTLAGFISMYADYKEQQEYVKWLTDVEALVK